MRGIGLTTLGADYTTLFSGDLGYSSGYLQVYNGLAEILMQTGPGQGESGEGGSVPAPPGIFPFSQGLPAGSRGGDLVFGVLARQFPGTSPTTPVTVVGAAFRPGDATLLPASPLTQTLSSTGAISGTGDLLGGIVAANGSVTAGTSFTVNHSATGTYVVSFSPALASRPSVVVSLNDTTTGDVISASSVGASGFTAVVELADGTGTRHDRNWNFLAQVPT